MTNREFYAALAPYDNWKNNGNNAAAHKALIEFLAQLKKTKPDRKVIDTKRGHFSYLPRLLAIQQALKERLYERACNRIITLIHFHCYGKNGTFAIQPQILISLISLLEKNLY